MSVPTDTFEGGCLCAAVRYRVAGPPLATSLCHCPSCRHASGAPAVAWSTFANAGFAFVAGSPARYASSPPVVRTFCPTCGTPLTYQHAEDADTIDVTTATLDHPERLARTREVWTAHRLAWVPLNPALEQLPRSSADARGEGS